MIIHTIFLALISIASCRYQGISCLASMPVTLWNTTSIPHPYVITGYDFLITWTQIYPTISSTVLSLTGFGRIGTNEQLSFNATIKNFTASGAIININPNPNKLVYLQFTVIITTGSCANKIEINSQFYLPTELNLNPRNNAPSGGQWSNQNFTFTPTQFTVTDLTNFPVIAFITDFGMFVPSGYQFQLRLSVITITWSQVIVNIFSHALKNNQLYCTTLSFMVINQAAFTDPVLIFDSSYVSVNINYINSSVVFQSSMINQAVISQRCLLGLTKFVLDTSISQNSIYLSSTLNGATIIIGNMSYSFYLIKCFYQCESGYQLISTASSYRCINCIDMSPTCLYCQTAYICQTQCSDVMINCRTCKNESVCQTCFIGNVVMNGCSTVPGCTAVLQFNPQTSSHYQQCSNCQSPEFYLNSQNTCSCTDKNSKIISGHCINVPGCTTAKKVGILTKCVSCNITLFMTLTNGTCFCGFGYHLIDNNCSQICGDGILFDLQCDDGNVKDGDGCSSLCKMEVFYICKNGSSTNKSECVYVAKALKIELVDIQKDELRNMGIFKFKFVPAIPRLSSMNITDYLNISINSTYLISSYVYSEGILKINMDYNEDLQQRNAQFNFSFDHRIINHLPIVLSFIIRSNGVKLLFSHNYDNYLLLRSCFQWFNVIIICIYAVSIFIDRMLAVELLHTFQLIYLLHLQTASNYTLYLSNFKCLIYTWFNPLFIVNKSSNLYLEQYLTRIHYEPQNYSISLTITAILIIGSSIIYLFVQILTYYLEIQNIGKRICNYIYRFIIFPVCIGIMQIGFMLVHFSAPQIETIYDLPPALKSKCKPLIIISLSIIFFNQWKFIFIESNKNQKIHKSKYIPLFLSYSFICFWSFYLFTFFNILYSKYLIFIVTCIALIAVFKCSPYRRSLLNATLVIYIILIAVFSLWMCARQLFQSLITEENQFGIVFFILLLVAVALVLTFIRLAYIAQKIVQKILCKTKVKEQIKLKQIKQQSVIKKYQKQQLINNIQQQIIPNKSKKQLNPYRLINLKKKEDLQRWEQQNKMRLMQGLSSLYNQRQFQSFKPSVFSFIARQNQDAKLKSNKKTLKSKSKIDLLRAKLKESFKQKKISQQRKMKEHQPFDY